MVGLTQWKQVLSAQRIIISTPQDLLDALRHEYVEQRREIRFLVSDEAHYAAITPTSPVYVVRLVFATGRASCYIAKLPICYLLNILVI